VWECGGPSATYAVVVFAERHAAVFAEHFDEQHVEVEALEQHPAEGGQKEVVEQHGD